MFSNNKLKSVADAVESIMEANRADIPAYLRKARGDKPLTPAEVNAPRKDSISAKENLAKNNGTQKESVEQIQEYESKGGVYKHQGTYGRAKDDEAGETDWDKEEKGEPKTKVKKSRKLGARQNYVRSGRVNEGFSSMLDTYEESGIKGLFEAWAKKKVMKEEPTNDEFTKELDKQKAKAAGKAPQADVAKPAVQAVQQEEVVSEELKGGQKKLDKNHNGKLDSDDFKKLRNEQTHTEIQVIDFNDVNGVKESTIDLDERTLTAGETKKKEEIVKSMKKGIEGFKERYGSRAKEVMYATATKQAKKD